MQSARAVRNWVERILRQSLINRLLRLIPALRPKQPLPSTFISLGFRREELDSDVAVEARVPGQIDFAHPARTESTENPVMGNRLRHHRPCLITTPPSGSKF